MSAIDITKTEVTKWNELDATQWIIVLVLGLAGLFLMVNLTDFIQSFQSTENKNKNKQIGIGITCALLFIAGAIYYGYSVSNKTLTAHNQLLSFAMISISVIGSIYLVLDRFAYDIKSIMNTGVSVIMFLGASYVGWKYSPGDSIKELIVKCKTP